MDYGQLLKRAWDIIWEHKFLILLGVLVALTSGNNSTPTGSGFQFRGNRDMEPPQDWELPNIPELPDLRRELGLPVLAGALLVFVIIVAVIVGLALWVVSTIARGGLIAGVNTITTGGSSTFGQAFGAGWQKGWRLLGIGIIPAIPGLILFLAGLGATGLLVGFRQVFGMPMRRMGPNVGILLAGIICVVLPISLVLNLLRTFANRGCMIEDLGVLESYTRGWRVLTSNLGEAFVLFVIQIGIGIALGLLMIVPGIIFALCCFLWPLLLLIQGAVSAYFSTLWTLAWQEWTPQQRLA